MINNASIGCKSRRRPSWLAGAVCAAALSLLAFTSVTHACPSCKEAVANADGTISTEPSSLGRGYSYSVLFMMAMPFALAAGFGGFCYHEFKKRSGGV